MSDNSELRDIEDNEAVQAVVDRVLSYQVGAPVETVRKELEDGLTSIGESRSEAWLTEHAQAISNADPAQS
jgi:vacuolar-type H+-ATPase subunit C/Vma6